MRYIQRGSDGKLIGHFANRQSYATEEAPDDHPDIVAWQAARDAVAAAPSPLEARLRAIEAELRALKSEK